MARAKNKTRPDGRKQAKIYLGTIDGRAKYKYVYAATQKELDAKVRDVKIAVGKGLDVTAANDKFGHWRIQWLKLKSHTVSTQRYISYESLSKKLEILDNSPVTRLTITDFQNVIFDNAHLSANTLVSLKSICKQVMQLAIDNRVIDYNPAANIKLPKCPKKTLRRALTETEQSWIINTPDYMQTAAMLMMYAGLRRGELLALMWTDVDLDAGTINVDKAAEVLHGKFETKYFTKTEAGMRTVYIPSILTEYLKGVKRSNNLYVFPAPQGGKFYTKTWNRKWEAYIKKLNTKYGDFSNYILDPGEELPIVIPYFTAHWLRHTFITMMYLAGIDLLTAKEQAGHNDVRTTMSIYTHLDSQYKKKKMDKLDEYLKNGCQMGVSSN